MEIAFNYAVFANYDTNTEYPSEQGYEKKEKKEMINIQTKIQKIGGRTKARTATTKSKSETM